MNILDTLIVTLLKSLGLELRVHRPRNSSSGAQGFGFWVLN